MKKLPVFIYTILFLAGNLYAQEFDYNSNCQKAYQTIFKLKINEGNQLLFNEKQVNKNNLIPYFLDNYSDFLSIYISDDAGLYNKLLRKKEERLRILSSGNSKSPFYLYSQASIYLQWAILQMKFGDYFSAVWDVRKAYNLLKDNKNKYPQFAPNDKDLAVLKTLFGAIPDKYKFGAKLLGLRGDIDEGLNDLGTLLKDPKMPFREEASILYTMLLLHLGKDKDGAWTMLDKLNLTLGDNLLNYFITASVAHYSGKNDRVIQILGSRPSSSAYFPFPFLDYMIGNAKLNKLDKDADTYLKKFISNYKGKDYLKETYRKLAWYGLVFNRTDLYKYYISKIGSVGNNSLDEDKAATAEAQSNKIPTVFLLKARLLSDGAYYNKALDLLSDNDPKNLSFDEKLEYYYRKARILDDMGQMSKAIPLYEWVIKYGDNSNTYFAPNSCIKLGNYYESVKNKNLATQYYKKALTYYNHEYKNSIDAQAKAGLNRIQ